MRTKNQVHKKIEVLEKKLTYFDRLSYQISLLKDEIVFDSPSRAFHFPSLNQNLSENANK